MWRFVTAGSIVLFALNAFLCQELFTTGFTDHMNSIESSFIALARYIAANAPNLDWFPLWYGGIPFQNSYPPLLHLTVAGWSALTTPAGEAPALAYHQITGLTYSLGAVTLFWAATGISGRVWTSFGAALGYSLFAPAIFLGRGGWTSFATPVRLEDMVVYGEGPHITGMMLLPLAMLALHRAVEKRTAGAIYLGALGLAAVALTNWVATFALSVIVSVYLLVRIGDVGSKGMDAARDWLRTAGCVVGCGILGYAMASPWIPPSTLADLSRNGRIMSGAYVLGPVEWAWIGGIIATCILAAWLGLRYGVGLMPRWGTLMAISLGGIVLADQWFGVVLIPQAARYHAEVEIALWLVTAFAIATVVDWVPYRIRMMLPAAVGILVMIQMVGYRDYAERVIVPIEIEDTVEYRVAKWLDEDWHPLTVGGEVPEVLVNIPQELPVVESLFLIEEDVEGLSVAVDSPPVAEEDEPIPGQSTADALMIQRGRVYVTGSTGFWFNVFTDTPKFGGGADQGAANPLFLQNNYGIPYTEGDGERTTAWLRAYGVEAVVVGGENTRDSYKDWHDPKKFDGVLAELWREGDDTIYAVPQRTGVPSFEDDNGRLTEPQVTGFLAHVLRPEDVIMQAPLNIEDSDSVTKLVAVFDDPEMPAAAFQWTSTSSARITGELAPGDLYYVQISHHDGWHAYRDGLTAPITEDALGQMVIEPRCAGPCEVTLVYDGGREMLLALGAMWSAIVGGLVWWALERANTVRTV